MAIVAVFRRFLPLACLLLFLCCARTPAQPELLDQSTLKLLPQYQAPVPNLIKDLQNPDAIVAISAARRLAQRNDLQAIPALLQAANAGNTNVRIAALQALARFGTRVPIEPLLATLHDPVAVIRAAGLEAVYRRPITREAFQALLPLSKDPDDRVRAVFVIQLSRQEGKEALDALLGLAQDENVDVRVRVIIALRQFISRTDDPRVAAAIQAALHDQAPAVRAMATRALSSFHAPEALALQMAGDADAGVRAAAIHLLISSPDPQRLPILHAALQDTASNVRQEAIHALAGVNQPEIRQALLACLRDQAPGVRRAALEALDIDRRSEVTEAIIAALQDPDTEVKQAAARLLALRNDTHGLELLITMLHGDDENRAHEAVQVLGILGPPAFPALVAALQDPRPRINQEAESALQNTQDSRLAALLLPLLQEKDPQLRLRVIDLLHDIRMPQVCDALLATLRDTNPRVREEAAIWLSSLEFTDPKVVPPLIAATQDRLPSVRQIAARALGRILDARAVQPLVALLKDADSDVRREATQALSYISVAFPEPVANGLLVLETDADPAVRVRALSIGGGQAFEPLIRAGLRDPDARVRVQALQSAHWRPSQEMRAAILAALGDTDARVRKAAVQSATAAGPDAIEPLLAVLQDKVPDIRQAALGSLAAFNDPRAIGAVVSAARQDEKAWRLAAIKAMTSHWYFARDPAAMEVLRNALLGDDAALRSAAANCLLSLRKKGTAVLLDALAAPRPEVKKIVLQVLITARDGRAVPPLLDLLQNEADASCRNQIIRMLGNLGDERAVPLLIGLLEQDPVADNRRQAADVLGKLKDPRAIPALSEVLQDKSLPLR